MKEPLYRINRILKSQRKGITSPQNCRLNAILKHDCAESPHCVYNERVAVRLGQTLHIPVADGVLTGINGETAYASLEVASPSIPLPDIYKREFPNTAKRYPLEVAALTAFDIFIGNWDRASNIKAALMTEQVSLFLGYDHSHSLLNIEEKEADSIARLNNYELIVRTHPFYGLVDKGYMEFWVARIASLADRLVHECCVFGGKFQGVTESVQVSMAKALIWRKNALAKIVADNLGTIRPLK